MGQDNERLDWLDKLRTITILMVVLYHVGGVYEGAGMWASFWIVDDPNTLTWVGIMGIVFDIMVMPLMFFIAGYLVPSSLQNKTAGEFLNKKLKRLMIPWLIAVLILIPIYKWFFLFSRGLPQESLTTYFHFTGHNTQNWLWFLPVLFLFDLLYLGVSKIRLPKISLNWGIVWVAVLGMISSVLISIFIGHRGWTHSFILDFENERVIMYFLVFLMGSRVNQLGILKQKPEKKLLYNIVSAISWMPITGHIFVRLIPFFVENFEFTWTYSILWWSTFYLSLLLLMYSMIATFQRYFHGTGKLWDALNSNSYGVYIIHVIMIGIFGTILLQLNMTAWIKYPALIILTYGFSNLIVSVYYRMKMKFQN